MVIVKENPIGLDAVVHHLQKGINNLSWGNLLTIYPRCYRAEREEGNTIEHYYANGDYEKVIFAEVNKVFFEQVGTIERENNTFYTTQLDVYFTVDLTQVKPDINHRADQEVQADVLFKLPSINTYGAIIITDSLITGIQNVYSSLRYKENDDIQPFHCFKVRLDVKFDPRQIVC